MSKAVISGAPHLAQASTSYAERQNLAMRMEMRRFTRLTSEFSKKLRNLEAAVALHFAHYNLCRVHETTRRTPAMASGLTDHAWSVGELVDTVLQADAPAPPPQPRPFQRRLPGLRVIRGGRR